VIADAFDPSRELLECFAEEAARLGVSLTRATVESFPLERAYDLVTSIHVLYYVTDWAAAIVRLRAALSARGRLCICLRSDDDVCRFKDEFLSKLQGAPVRERTSTQLEALLDRMGLPHATDLVASRLDLSDALRMEPGGTEVIEFLLRRPFASVPAALRAEIMAYLRERHPDGGLTQLDGFVWIPAAPTAPPPRP
jgi:SAM-dependent methyltransferase